jgi:hypothetical protein
MKKMLKYLVIAVFDVHRCNCSGGFNSFDDSSLTEISKMGSTSLIYEIE